MYFPSYSLFLIHFTMLSSHVGLLAPTLDGHRLGGMPSVLLMSDLGRKPESSGGTDIRPARWKYSFSPCPPQKASPSPLTCLVSVSPARNSITIFPFITDAALVQTGIFPTAPNRVLHLQSSLIPCFPSPIHFHRWLLQSPPTLVFPSRKSA